MIRLIYLILVLIPGSIVLPPPEFDLAHPPTPPNVFPAQAIHSGWWSQYAKQPTDLMISYRGYENQENIAGFIAVVECGRVGEYAWIKINGSPWLRVRVFDCMGAGGDPEWWRVNRILGEIDYYLADEFDVVGRGGVRAYLVWEAELRSADSLNILASAGR